MRHLVIKSLPFFILHHFSCFISFHIFFVRFSYACIFIFEARECFKALDDASLRAPIPFSLGKVGDDSRYLATLENF